MTNDEFIQQLINRPRIAGPTSPAVVDYEALRQLGESIAGPAPQPVQQPAVQQPPIPRPVPQPTQQIQPLPEIDWRRVARASNDARARTGLAGMFSALGRRGFDPQAVESAAMAPYQQAIMQQQMEESREGRQRASQMHALNVLAGKQRIQEFERKQKELQQQEQLQLRQADPYSYESHKARKELQTLNPEFWDSLPEQYRGTLSMQDIIKGAQFSKALENSRQVQLASEKGEDTLKRQKELAEHGWEHEERVALLQSGRGRLSAQERTAERVARGGYEEQAEGIRDVTRERFPEGYLEVHPEVEKSIRSIEEASFKRGSVNKEHKATIDGLVKRAEQDQAYNIPGWKRMSGPKTPELRPQEIEKAREAASAYEELKASVRKLDKIRESIDATDFATAQLGFETEQMANSLALQEQVFNNLRIVGNYGAPQSYELKRMETQVPRFDTVHGFINGMKRLKGMVGAITIKMKEKMRVNGYLPDTGPSVPGVTIERVR